MAASSDDESSEEESSDDEGVAASAAAAPTAAASAGGLRPTATSALKVLEAAFPANTREINEECLRKTMRYFCEPDGTVVGVFHTEKDGKRHFLQVLAVSTDRRGCGLGTYLLARAAHDIPAGRSLYVQADTADVQRAGGGTTSAQAFYEKHGMEACEYVDDAEDCIALRASASALRDLGAKRPDGLVGCSYAFDDDDIASLPAEVLVEDSSDGEEDSSDGEEEEQTDEEGASVAYDVDSIPAGELPDTANDNMGNGGCTAHALFKLGVFATVGQAKVALNAAGEQILAKRRAEVRGDYERLRVYKADDYWLHEVIKVAVVKAGYDFRKLDLTDAQCSLAEEVHKGAVLIDGIQNQHWMKGTVSEETNPHCSWHTNAPDYTGLGPEAAPGRWRHSIAVKKGRVLEQRDDEFSARWLWMGEGNRPNPERGYMRRILKAYTVTPKRAARKQMQVRDTDQKARFDARAEKKRRAVGGEWGAKRARR